MADPSVARPPWSWGTEVARDLMRPRLLSAVVLDSTIHGDWELQLTYPAHGVVSDGAGPALSLCEQRA